MNVECSKCDATYNIPDSKIPDGNAKFRCKKCQNIIEIRSEINSQEDQVEPTAQPDNVLINKTKKTASALSEKAVNFGKKAKESATQFKEFANEKTSSYLNESKKSEKFNTKLNQFLFFSFKIGKYISAFCIVAFFLVFLGSVIFYVNSFGTSFEKPEFNPYLYKANNSGDSNKNDFSTIDERREIQDKFDKKIREIINLGFSKEDYDVFIEFLSTYPKEYRKAYINGLYDYVKAGKEYVKKGFTQALLYNYLESYNEKFTTKLRHAKEKEIIAGQDRWYIIGVIAFSMLLFMLFLMIPILIKIEENTRLKKSGTSPEMEIANMAGNNDIMVSKQSNRQEHPMPQ